MITAVITIGVAALLLLGIDWLIRHATDNPAPYAHTRETDEWVVQ